MKQCMLVFLAAWMLLSTAGAESNYDVWTITTEAGEPLTQICEEPSAGDEYISADNQHYQIVDVHGNTVTARHIGAISLPSVEWLDADMALPVSATSRRIALYCTHSDESYEPTDGFYTTTDRGTIYQVAQTLADSLDAKGLTAEVSLILHHPHDAGAYRRSRQTAIALMKSGMPDALIDIHRDGIPNPDSYAVTIGGREASKIRLLVGRGNQNAEINKEFALMIKAVADRVYPGLIKDIYMGKGAFNQDLLPHSILLECGTYTLPRERVLVSMPMMADVLDRALYGGVVGSAGRTVSDVSGSKEKPSGGLTMGAPDTAPASQDVTGTGTGFGFLGILLIVGIVGFAILSTGSLRSGMKKSARNLSEMTGGLIGKPPEKEEDPKHS